jgi:hypothetical protein
MREIPKMLGWPLLSPHPKAPYFGEYSDLGALPYIKHEWGLGRTCIKCFKQDPQIICYKTNTLCKLKEITSGSEIHFITLH